MIETCSLASRQNTIFTIWISGVRKSNRKELQKSNKKKIKSLDGPPHQLVLGLVWSLMRCAWKLSSSWSWSFMTASFGFWIVFLFLLLLPKPISLILWLAITFYVDGQMLTTNQRKRPKAMWQVMMKPLWATLEKHLPHLIKSQNSRFPMARINIFGKSRKGKTICHWKEIWFVFSFIFPSHILMKTSSWPKDLDVRSWRKDKVISPRRVLQKKVNRLPRAMSSPWR